MFYGIEGIDGELCSPSSQVRGGDQCLLGDSVTEVTSSPVSTWTGDRQGRLSDVNLWLFVGVDLNL